VTLLPTVKPFAVSTNPPAGAVNVATSVSPTVTFSESMDPNSLGGNVYVRKNGGATVASSNSYDPASKTYTVNPGADLDPSTAYEIVAKAAVKDAAGNTMAADYVVGFTTAAPAPVAPQLIQQVPAPGATGVSVGTVVTATFDQDMDATTLTNASFMLTKSGSATAVPATVSYVGATKTAMLDPTADLEPNALYNVTLTNAAVGANALAVQGAPVSWSFTTAAAGGPTFPDVPPGHTYHDAIQGMADLGIINGYSNGNFGPGDPVRRWQFAKMIVGALSLPIFESDSASPPFTDLDADDIFAIDMTEFVAVAYKKGITNGTTATTFGPYTYISRTQVVTMVVRAVQGISPSALATPAPGYLNTWGTGYSSIHGQPARIAEYNGLLAGIDLAGVAGNPYSQMPRGEVAQILWNMMDLLSLR
ncbi:MAG: Ig-like domain-containing protein, partial [Thermoleophilia bacterium]